MKLQKMKFLKALVLLLISLLLLEFSFLNFYTFSIIKDEEMVFCINIGILFFVLKLFHCHNFLIIFFSFTFLFFKFQQQLCHDM